jgi:hypothetical protein
MDNKKILINITIDKKEKSWENNQANTGAKLHDGIVTRSESCVTFLTSFHASLPHICVINGLLQRKYVDMIWHKRLKYGDGWLRSNFISLIADVAVFLHTR